MWLLCGLLVGHGAGRGRRRTQVGGVVFLGVDGRRVGVRLRSTAGGCVRRNHRGVEIGRGQLLRVAVGALGPRAALSGGRIVGRVRLRRWRGCLERRRLFPCCAYAWRLICSRGKMLLLMLLLLVLWLLRLLVLWAWRQWPLAGDFGAMRRPRCA